MQDVNTVTLAGRLTRDAEMKHTQGGTALAQFSVACNERKKSGDEWTEEASFFDCVLWGRLAEAIVQYMTKGTQVVLSGRLQQDRWEQDGQKRSKVKVNVKEIQLLGGRSESKAQPRQPANQGNSFEDDVPF